MRRLIITLLALGIVVVAARQLSVQAQGCTGAHCVYVPALNGSNGPTATIRAFGPIPPVLDGPCTVHEPAPVEGGQAWIDGYNLAPGESATLCVRLIEHGQVVVNAPIGATIHYPDREASITTQRTGGNGVAVLPFTVGSVAPGQLMVIDVVAVGMQQDWPAQAMFLSQAVPTSTPAPTVTKTPSPTPTNTPTATP